MSTPIKSADAATVMRLLQFTDSAFPVGTFSFSNGLETAATERLVHDAATLEAFTREIVRQEAFTDGIAAIHAWRSHRAARFEGVTEADRQLILCKMNEEARLMTRRMGKKLAELALHILHDEPLERWLRMIGEQRTPGTYPVAQGIVFSAAGVGERELFCSQQYGAANMVLSAALRCVRVSHYDTQRILWRIGEGTEALYAETAELEPEDMFTFTPQIDILASLHEKGTQRMFMN